MGSKKIYIIGYGAIGKALAVLLKQQKKQVFILRGSVEKIQPYMEEIEVELSNGSIVSEIIKISSLSQFSELEGIILLTSKSYGNKRIASLLNKRSEKSPIVLLQNGIGIEDHFINLCHNNVYRCVLFATSQMLSSFRLRFRPVSASLVGVIRGNIGELESIVKDISTSIFPFVVERDIQSIIWRKAIINSVFNSVCTLLEVDNGIFSRNEQSLRIAEDIIQECLPIAKEYGVTLKLNEVRQNLLLISKSSDGQLISTLQDIKKNKPTEIDTLNLEIARLARKLGRSSYVKETELLGKLVKIKAGLQKNGLKRD